jgi:hypothetical protein
VEYSLKQVRDYHEKDNSATGGGATFSTIL